MGLGSGIRKKPIPDPGVKKAPDPQHWLHCMIIANAVSLLQVINLMKFFYSSGDPATVPASEHRRGLRNRHASQIPYKTSRLVFEIWLSIRRKGFTKHQYGFGTASASRSAMM